MRRFDPAAPAGQSGLHRLTCEDPQTGAVPPSQLHGARQGPGTAGAASGLITAMSSAPQHACFLSHIEANLKSA